MEDESVIEIRSGEFDYTGKKIVVLYHDGNTAVQDLTEDMIPDNEKLKFYKIGEHEVKVVYQTRYQTTMKVNVVRHEFDDTYKLDDLTVTYDGYPHKIELGHDLPEGATINYVYGNTFTSAGTYDVIGVVSKEGYVSKTLTAKLTIEKADFDMSNVTFEDATFIYDGNPHVIEATNVPGEITVTYSIYNEGSNIRITNAVDAGRYRIVANFRTTNTSYNPIPDKEATLTINKATYDMSTITFNDVEKEYDGSNGLVAVNAPAGLPSGVKVSYKVYKDGSITSDYMNAGTYTMVAEFSGDERNYERIDSMSATLKIVPQTVEISKAVTFESETVTYDGNEHKIEVKGTLPQGIAVKYEYVSDYSTPEDTSETYAGEYIVYARFSSTDVNKLPDIEYLEAYLTINYINETVTVTADKISYDPGTMSVSVDLSSVDPEDKLRIADINLYSISEGEETVSTKTKGEDGNYIFTLVSGTTYLFEISLEYEDPNLARSIIIPVVTGQYTYNG